MILENINLVDFRNISSANLAFNAHINLFHGENGQGKTSILEAIFALCFSRSFRERSDSVITRHDSAGYNISGNFKDLKKEFKLKVSFLNNKKSIFLNSARLTKNSEVVGLVPIVVLTPADLKLTEGGPAERRLFFDVVLSQVYPVYLNALQRLKQAFKQKNEILDSAVIHPHERDLISAWNEVIAKQITVVTQKRDAFNLWLNEHAEDAYRRIAGKDHDLKLNYKPSISGSTEEVSAFLEQKLDEEIKKRQAIYGPHRDDISIELNNKPIRQTGSQGENKTTVIVLKLLEIKYLQLFRKTNPLILFDDIFSELDNYRTENLIEEVRELGQVFITTTNRRFDDQKRWPIQYFEVKGGKVIAA